MTHFASSRDRAISALVASLGSESAAQQALTALERAGFDLADGQSDELVTRWVNVTERAVPPEADTIIRTITRTSAAGQVSTTHWLDGLRGPNI